MRRAVGGRVTAEYRPREVETAVANGRSLLGIGVSRHHTRGLDYTPLFNETNYLYCASGHPLFDCKAEDTQKLLQRAEVITSNYMRDKERRNDGLNYQNTAIAYHDEGLFKTILPQQYRYQIPVALITSNNHSGSPLAQAMIDAIKQCYSFEK